MLTVLHDLGRHARRVRVDGQVGRRLLPPRGQQIGHGLAASAAAHHVRTRHAVIGRRVEEVLLVVSLFILRFFLVVQLDWLGHLLFNRRLRAMFRRRWGG